MIDMAKGIQSEINEDKKKSVKGDKADGTKAGIG
jgi:hypothetical protein